MNVPHLTRKKIDWSTVPEDGILWALYWDRLADPGDMNPWALSASSADMYLNGWIIIPTSDADPQTVADLRPLDLDFGGGVTALWSDNAQSIMAFAFSQGAFTEATAREWMQESKNLTASAFGEDDAILALMSFDAVRDLVYKAINAQLQIPENTPDNMPQPRTAWILEISPEKAIYEYLGTNYLVHYEIVENEVVLGVSEPVSKVWQLENTEEIVQLSDNEEPVIFYAFTSQMLDGEEAGQGDDLIWKEVLHPGQWFKTNSGKQIEITPDIILSAYQAFQDGMPKYVSVPTNHHHMTTSGVVPAEENRGFVRKLKVIENRLFAGFDLTSPETKQAVKDGSIADCSVFLQPNVFHNGTGEKYPWVLRHVLLTNDPLVNDLSGFNAIPASGSDATIEVFTITGGIMPNGEPITLSSEQAAMLETLAAKGLSAEDVIALAEREQAIAAQAAELRQKKRDLHIVSIVDAMQGKGEHPGIVQVAGTVHYPVVASAIETALKGMPAALALDAQDDGTTPVDNVLLAIVNAIPEAGRLALNAADKPAQPPKTEKTVLTDEELKAAMQAKGL